MTEDIDLREQIDERNARRGRRVDEDVRQEDVRQEGPRPEAATRGTERDDGKAALFAEDRTTALRERWADIQARFVDDPQKAVHDADALVDEVVDELTKRFDEERSALEAKWSREEKVDTEELRVSIRRYRAFFERLLSL